MRHFLNRGITGYVIQRCEHDGDDFVSAGADGRTERLHNSDIGGYGTYWTYTEPEPGTLYKWVGQLVNSQNATVIETSLSVRTPPEPGTTVLSSDATLSDLTLSGIDAFNPPRFDGNVTSYVGSFANSVTETTVTATTRHSSATYAVKLGGVTDADGTVSLAVGTNVITVEVTAEDLVTTKTYTITVTRAAASIWVPDLVVSSVSIDSSSAESIDLIAPSAPGTFHYGACVDTVSDELETTNNCSSVAVRVNVADPNSLATGAPIINGTAQVGQTLTADTSGIADSDGLTNVAYKYQWLADDAEIASATGNTCVLTSAELGKAVKVRVSFTDDAGNEETLTSAATTAVAAKPNSPATGVPTISGTAQVGETLTADTTEIADSDRLADVSFTYEWLADDADVDGATGYTYRMTS